MVDSTPESIDDLDLVSTDLAVLCNGSSLGPSIADLQGDFIRGILDQFRSVIRTGNVSRLGLMEYIQDFLLSCFFLWLSGCVPRPGR